MARIMKHHRRDLKHGVSAASGRAGVIALRMKQPVLSLYGVETKPCYTYRVRIIRCALYGVLPVWVDILSVAFFAS